MRRLLWTLSWIVRSSMTRPTNTLRTRPGRNACGRGLLTATSYLSKCTRLCLNPKGLAVGKLTQSKSGQAPVDITERQNWIQDKFNFLKTHIRCKGLKSSNFQPSSPKHKEPVHLLSQHTTSADIQPTWMVWRSECDQTPRHSLHLQAQAQFPSIQQSTNRSWTSLHR